MKICLLVVIFKGLVNCYIKVWKCFGKGMEIFSCSSVGTVSKPEPVRPRNTKDMEWKLQPSDTIDVCGKITQHALSLEQIA